MRPVRGAFERAPYNGWEDGAARVRQPTVLCVLPAPGQRAVCFPHRGNHIGWCAVRWPQRGLGCRVFWCQRLGRAAMPWRNAAISAGPPVILAMFRKSQTKNDLTKMAFRSHTRLS